MNINPVAHLIKKHEGLSLKPYKCTAGKLTIGYGRNIEDKGISQEEAERFLDDRLYEFRDKMVGTGVAEPC